MMSHQHVRAYVRGWTAYHSGPNADVEALTTRVCRTLHRPAPDAPLTRTNRKQLETALGTKDADGAPTLADITRAVLSSYLDEPCSRRTARAVARAVVKEYETGWDLNVDTPLPKALVSAHEDLLNRDLTPERARKLVEGHTSQPGAEFSGGT